MLYMLGAVELDTNLISADSVQRVSNGGLVAKPVIGGRQRKEATGEGEDDITITGTLVPSRLGGLNSLEALQEMRRVNARFPVMRGDGYRFRTWYSIKQMTESHEDLTEQGLGFIIVYSVTLEQADERPGDGQQVIQSLLSLFNIAGVL
jgi:phage protein U